MFKGISGFFSLMIFVVIFASPELNATTCRIAKNENFIRIDGHGTIAVRDNGGFSHSDLKVSFDPPKPPKWNDGEVATFEAGDVFTRIGEPKGGGSRIQRSRKRRLASIWSLL